MPKKPIIYCLESVWNYGGNYEPSVEPMLALLSSMGYWDYRRRDCATLGEMEYYLQNEWAKCAYGSILYFATHGGPGELSLTDNEAISLSKLQGYIGEAGAEGCLVHFCSCSVMAADEATLDGFVSHTKAAAISGYTEDTGWTALSAPAVSLELLYFSEIAEQQVDLRSGHSRRKLRPIADRLQCKFSDCGFTVVPP